MDLPASNSPAKPTKNELRTPIYAIYKLDDGSLFWYPLKRSSELAEALKHHFPNTKGLKYRMLEAIARFNQDIRSGAGLQPREAEWKMFGGQPQGLGKEKRESFLNGQKICYGNGEIEAPCIRIPNRGMACDYHRSAKTQCNPKTCRGNKLFKPSAAREIEPEIRNTTTPERESSTIQSKPYIFSFKNDPPRFLDVPSEMPRSQSPYIDPSNYIFGRGSLSERDSRTESQHDDLSSEDDKDPGDSNSTWKDKDDSDPRRYGDYWKPFDDSNDPSAPFNGGNIEPGGGFSKPDGGYYSFGGYMASSQTGYSYTSTIYNNYHIGEGTKSASSTSFSPRIYGYTYNSKATDEAVPRSGNIHTINGALYENNESDDDEVDILDAFGNLRL